MLQLSFVNFKRGSYLFVEGTPQSDRFYIIQVGQVQCVTQVKIPGEQGRMLGPGDFVGVIPCMSNHMQIETAIAMTDVTCIAVYKSQYPELIAQNTPVAMKIIRTFANRMRVLNSQLTRLTLNNVTMETPEELFRIAAYFDGAGKRDVATYGYYQYLKACPNGINLPKAKERFIALKPTSKAVYFESSADPTRTYPKNTMIFSECQTGNDMFIIQKGEVTISKVVNGNEVILALLKKGDMFGEMALIENKPRSANAIVHDDCVLMVVNQKNFNQMVSTQPQLIARLTTTLADRLWSMYRQLANTQISEPWVKLLDMISLQIEKSKTPIAPRQQYQSDVTLEDLANMCGIPTQNQPAAIIEFQKMVQFKMVGGKIFIPNTEELVKQATVHRNKLTEQRK